MQIKMLAAAKTKAALLGWVAAVLAVAAIAPSPAQALPNCAGLAALLAQDPDLSAATSVVVPAAGANLAYCNVQITYSHLAGPAAGYQSGQKQVNKIGIGLPLSLADGGSGGVQGAWNGRIEDLGGGGYNGSVGATTNATNLNYVGSATDTGHVGGSPLFALNSDGTLNSGLVNDFAYNGIHAQSVYAKKVALMYYGMSQTFAYWVGCSEGGHQASIQAQRYPYDHDGIIAGHPVFHLDRLQPQQLWGQVVANVELGAPVANTKLASVTQGAITACQNNFGGTPDGIVQDPRACTFDPHTWICGSAGAPADPTMCLTAQEANVVQKIWAGISNDGQVGGGGPFYVGQDKGAPITGLSGSNLPPFSVPYFQAWVFQNATFDWHTFTEETYQSAIVLSEQKFRQVQANDDPDLSRFRAHGGKIMYYHGGADQLVPMGGTINYYNQLVAHDGSLASTQSYARLFLWPGNNHCGGNALAPAQPNAPVENTTDMLAAMAAWVENGVAPNTITGYNNASHAAATVTRPICKYPDTLTYNGSGSVFSASNFTCTPQTSDPLAYKSQMNNDVGPTITFGTAPTHDFNYSKRSAVLLRDTSGNVGTWLFSPTTAIGVPSPIAQTAVEGNVATTWSVVGQRDFANSGDASVLWRDTVGDAAIWQMNGTQVQGAYPLSPVPGTWSVVGTGNFSNNQTQIHQGDILWQDNQGNLAIWFMNGAQVTSSQAVGQLPANWTVVGSDANGWIFLRNSSTGEVGVWVMNGAKIAMSVDFGSVSSNWQIAGIGDFDGDGYSDILWRDNSGNVGIWTLRPSPASIAIGSSPVLGNVPLTWTIVQTGDYNGDGFSDILWQDNSGNVAAWYMNGSSIASTTIFGKIGSNWAIQALNSQ